MQVTDNVAVVTGGASGIVVSLADLLRLAVWTAVIVVLLLLAIAWKRGRQHDRSAVPEAAAGVSA